MKNKNSSCGNNYSFSWLSFKLQSSVIAACKDTTKMTWQVYHKIQAIKQLFKSKSRKQKSIMINKKSLFVIQKKFNSWLPICSIISIGKISSVHRRTCSMLKPLNNSKFSFHLHLPFKTPWSSIKSECSVSKFGLCYCIRFFDICRVPGQSPVFIQYSMSVFQWRHKNGLVSGRSVACLKTYHRFPAKMKILRQPSFFLLCFLNHKSALQFNISQLTNKFIFDVALSTSCLCHKLPILFSNPHWKSDKNFSFNFVILVLF